MIKFIQYSSFNGQWEYFHCFINGIVSITKVILCHIGITDISSHIQYSAKIGYGVLLCDRWTINRHWVYQSSHTYITTYVHRYTALSMVPCCRYYSHEGWQKIGKITSVVMLFIYLLSHQSYILWVFFRMRHIAGGFVISIFCRATHCKHGIMLRALALCMYVCLFLTLVSWSVLKSLNVWKMPCYPISKSFSLFHTKLYCKILTESS